MKYGPFGIWVAAASMLAVAAGSAQAGGLERGGHNIDLLFEPTPFALEATGAYVMPQRKLDNVTNLDPAATGRTDGIGDTESYFVPRIGFKVGIGDHVDCIGDYTQPWGAHTNPGIDWVGARSNIETKIDSDGYAATCSYKMQVGQGQFRILGGAFYHQLEGYKERLVVPALLPMGLGLGRLDMEETGWGWRIGGAYEIPEIALRASLVYNSSVKLDHIRGSLDLTGVPSWVDLTNPLLGAVTPVFGSASMPESVELKIQSGIAPGWLAFGSVKWVNWSVLQSVAFCPEATSGLVPCFVGGPSHVTELDLFYRDGWTVSGGVGHRFNEQWSALASLTWDRGTSTIIGHQTDTWTLAAGVAFAPNDHAEFRLGGALGVLTSGTSGLDRYLTSYSFGNDLVGAVSASAKITW